MLRTTKLNCTSPRVSTGDSELFNVSPPLTRGLAHQSVAIILVLIGFFLVSPVFPQTTGGVKGKVRNMSDQGIAGATISARQNGVDLKTAKTDARGNFLLDGLEPGTYNLAFEANGYSAAVQYNVEIKKGKPRDLGGRLILLVDRGMMLIIQGSVFYKNGTSVYGAEVKAERVNPDGSTKRVATLISNESGEFSIRPPIASAKYRFTAKFKDETVTKDIDVDSAGIYRLALSFSFNRGEK